MILMFEPLVEPPDVALDFRSVCKGEELKVNANKSKMLVFKEKVFVKYGWIGKDLWVLKILGILGALSQAKIVERTVKMDSFFMMKG